MVERADGWKAKDGTFFEHKQQAVDREAFEDIKQFCIDSDIRDDDDSREGAAMILWRHRGRVVEILGRASTPSDLEKISG